MTARVIVARRADTCGACSQPIPAGERINYTGFGGVSHEACPVVQPARRSGRKGYAYSSRTSYARSRGRCEDAPCCGCCD